jgi:hypothetical protein
MTNSETLVNNEIAKIFAGNYLDYRQQLADEYWDLQVAKQLEKESSERLTKKARKARIATLKASDPEKFLYMLTNAISQGGKDWSPYTGESLPIPTKVSADIAKSSGLNKSVLEQMDQSRREPTLSEAVAIAYAMNTDLASMLTPSGPALESDEEIPLSFITGHQLLAHEWLIWIRGLRALPTQNVQAFISNTAGPRLERNSIETRKMYREESTYEALARSSSSVAAYDLADSTSFPNGQIEGPQNPFESVISKVSYTPGHGVEISKLVFFFFTGTRKILVMKYSGKKLATLATQFTNWRRLIVSTLSRIVRLLNSYSP